MWASGAEIGDLNLLGIKPKGCRAVLVLGIATIAVQAYWFLARYWHLRESSTRILPAAMTESKGAPADIDWEGEWNEAAHVSVRVADWLANWAAFGLTLLSWCILIGWMWNAVQ